VVINHLVSKHSEQETCMTNFFSQKELSGRILSSLILTETATHISAVLSQGQACRSCTLYLTLIFKISFPILIWTDITTELGLSQTKLVDQAFLHLETVFLDSFPQWPSVRIIFFTQRSKLCIPYFVTSMCSHFFTQWWLFGGEGVSCRTTRTVS
jgi:hypothetical protein